MSLKELISIVSFCSCSLAVSISLIFCIFFVKNGNYNANFPSRLVFFLTINDIVNWLQLWIYDLIVIVTQTKVAQEYCVIFAFFNNFTCLLTLTITFTICFLSYLSTVWQINIEKERTYIVLLIIILITFAMNSIPLIWNNYGETPTNFQVCWISSPEIQFYGYYIILILFFLIEIYLITHSLFRIYRLPFLNRIFKRKLLAYLILFPLNLFIAWLPGMILDIMLFADESFGDHYFSYILDLMDSLFEPFEAIFNCVIYLGIEENLRRKVFRFFYSNNHVEEQEGSINSEINTDDNNNNNKSILLN